jgi:hypothetical protein
LSYLSDFERSFSEHTLEIVKGYQGPFDATIVVNCLGWQARLRRSDSPHNPR